MYTPSNYGGTPDPKSNDLSKFLGKDLYSVRTSAPKYRESDKSHTDLARQLDNMRKQYKRRAERLEQMASSTPNSTLAAEYAAGAESLREEIKLLRVKEIVRGAKAGSMEWQSAIQDKLENARALIRNTPLRKVSTETNRELLGSVQMKYAAHQLMVYTYGDLWDSSDTPQQRWAKLRYEVYAHSEEVLGRHIENPTNMDILDYFERTLQIFYNDDSFQFDRSAFGAQNTYGKYERELENAYSGYHRGLSYEVWRKTAKVVIKSRGYGMKGKK